MDEVYHDGSRALQDRRGTRALADRVAAAKVRDHLREEDRAYIEARDMVFVATADAAGRPTCSYKGGDPGFVRVLGPRELAFPDYDGNGMLLSWGNVSVNPHVGLLFVDFERPSRLRVEGSARVALDDPLLPEWPEAQMVIRVTPERVYPNCPRYIHRMALVERSRYVPRPGTETPEAEWKAQPWARPT